MSASATLSFEKTGESLTLRLGGYLAAETMAEAWTEFYQKYNNEKNTPKTVTVDASEVSYCDGTGIAFLLDIQNRYTERGATVSIKSLAPEFVTLFNLYASTPKPSPFIPDREGFFTEIGHRSAALIHSIADLVSFTGQLTASLLKALSRPAKIRWKDTLNIAQKVGADALPIVFVLSLLMGLIIAFQAAIPMKQFGAEIYIADLAGLAMVRELGPLVTAIILAGRSASAFAAEIGTMKINEEINALKTMSIDPLRFLLVPRVLAGVGMTPLLTVFANIAGILGAGIVLISMGYSIPTYINKVLGILNLTHFSIGIFKSFFFGLLVAGIGCLRGFQTSVGATAVGNSTTRAVVSGITLIVIADGIFAVICFYLKI